MNKLTRAQLTEEMQDFYGKISNLRNRCRETLGGITYEKKFGIYKMCIPNNEAFFNYVERHLVETEKLMQCFFDSVEKQEKTQKTEPL